MDLEDLFKPDPEETRTMGQREFFERAKSVLEKIYSSYSQGWQNRVLMDDEFPEESVCEKCTGCGVFLENGEERECFQDREHGDCFHRFCDYEQVGLDLETHIEEVCDLLSVDEVLNN